MCWKGPQISLVGRLEKMSREAVALCGFSQRRTSMKREIILGRLLSAPKRERQSDVKGLRRVRFDLCRSCLRGIEQLNVGVAAAIALCCPVSRDHPGEGQSVLLLSPVSQSV